jgi:Arc/MetJ-type ribon-helix-helix transcriptional regulator
MRSLQTMTVSLPTELIRKVDRLRKAQDRGRSELVREALRFYFDPELAARIGRLPVYNPTKRELRELEKGRQEMRRGESLTPDEFFRHLDRPAPKARAKGRRASTTG